MCATGWASGLLAVGPERYGERVSIATLDLDLDLFSGPFDLLLTLILREEVDLMELQLADVVLAYLDHLETQGDLDLETATEFIVLIAALLELKSRLMLSGSEEDELLDIEPAQAAEELLARMLEARRYRAAAGHLGELLAGRGRGALSRSAAAGEPAPNQSPSPRMAREPGCPGSGARSAAGDAAGDQPAPHRRAAHHGLRALGAPARPAAARALQLRRGGGGADRMTVAVTLFALLELYKRGEANWEQEESFGEIAIHACAVQAPGYPEAVAG